MAKITFEDFDQSKWQDTSNDKVTFEDFDQSKWQDDTSFTPVKETPSFWERIPGAVLNEAGAALEFGERILPGPAIIRTIQGGESPSFVGQIGTAMREEAGKYYGRDVSKEPAAVFPGYSEKTSGVGEGITAVGEGIIQAGSRFGVSAESQKPLDARIDESVARRQRERLARASQEEAAGSSMFSTGLGLGPSMVTAPIGGTPSTFSKVVGATAAQGATEALFMPETKSLKDLSEEGKGMASRYLNTLGDVGIAGGAAGLAGAVGFGAVVGISKAPSFARTRLANFLKDNEYLSEADIERAAKGDLTNTGLRTRVVDALQSLYKDKDLTKRELTRMYNALGEYGGDMSLPVKNLTANAPSLPNESVTEYMQRNNLESFGYKSVPPKPAESVEGYQDRLNSLLLQKSTGDITDNKVLLGTQRATMKGDVRAESFADMQKESAALTLEILNPQAYDRAYQKLMSPVMTKAADDYSQLTAKLDELSPKTDKDTVNKGAFDKLYAVYKDFLSKKDMAYKAAIPDNTKIDKELILNAVKDVYDSVDLEGQKALSEISVLNTYGLLPTKRAASASVVGEIPEQAEQAATTGGALTMRSVSEIKNALSSAIDSLYKKGEGFAAGQAIKVRDNVDNVLDNLITALPEGDAKRQAAESALREFSDRFGKIKTEQNLLLETQGKGLVESFQAGKDVTGSSVSTYLDPDVKGKIAADKLAEFKKIYGADAANIAKQYILNKIVANPGTNIVKTLDKVEKTYAPIFKEYPSISLKTIKQEIIASKMDAEDSLNYLKELSGNKNINVSEGTPTIDWAITKPTVQKYVYEALNKGDVPTLAKIKSQFKTPEEAKEAVRQFAFDYLAENALKFTGTTAGQTVGRTQARDLYAALQTKPDVRKAWKELLGKDEFELFQRSLEVSDAARRAIEATKTTPGESLTAENLGPAVTELARVFGIGAGSRQLRGLGSAGRFFDNLFKNSAMEEAAYRMLYDPAFLQKQLKLAALEMDGNMQKGLDLIHNSLVRNGSKLLVKGAGTTAGNLITSGRTENSESPNGILNIEEKKPTKIDIKPKTADEIQRVMGKSK